MNTTVLEAPTLARKSAGYPAPKTAPLHVAGDEEALGIPWYMTMEEVYAELDQAIDDVKCGRCISQEDMVKEVATWKSFGHRMPK
jgi:hypothetical protein